MAKKDLDVEKIQDGEDDGLPEIDLAKDQSEAPGMQDVDYASLPSGNKNPIAPSQSDSDLISRLAGYGQNSVPTDSESSIVADAKSAPVRPEYNFLSAMNQANYPSSPGLGRGARPDDLALQQLDEIDDLKANPDKYSEMDRQRIQGYLKGFNPVMSDRLIASSEHPVTEADDDDDDSDNSTPNKSKVAANSKPKDDDDSDDDEEDETPSSKSVASQNLQKLVNKAAASPSAQSSGFSGALSDDALQAAMQQQKKDMAYAQMARAAGQIGAATSRGFNYDDAPQKAMEQNANLPVQQIMQGRQAKVQDLDFQDKQRLDDPNSAESQMTRAMAKQAGINVPDNVSAGHLKGLGINPTSLYDAYQNRLLREKMGEQNLLLRQSMLGNQQAKANNKELDNMDQQLLGGRMPPEVRQAKLDSYNADKALSLLGNDTKIAPEKLKTIIGDIGKIATGGVPTHEEMKAISPQTASMLYAKYKSFLTGNPSPVDMAGFINMYKGILNNVKNHADGVVSNHVNTVLDMHRSQIGEDNYNRELKKAQKYFNLASSQGDDRSPQGQSSGHKYKPGDIVNYKGQNYRVGADGDTLENL